MRSDIDLNKAGDLRYWVPSVPFPCRELLSFKHLDLKVVIMIPRFSIAIFSIAIFSAWSSPDCFAQEASSQTLNSVGDGFPIKITYYPAPSGGNQSGPTKEAPVVVIVPGEDENRTAWDKGSSPRNVDRKLPEELQRSGFAVITVDLRKQGESVLEGREESIKPIDYQRMVVGDLEAVKEFIFKEHQAGKLNMRKLGLIGSGSGAAIASTFAEYDWKKPPYDDHALVLERTPRGQDVRALVLISPHLKAGDAKTGSAMNFLKNPNFQVALMVIVGEADNDNYKNGQTLYKQFSNVKGAEERSVLWTPPLKDHGIALLQQPVQVAYNPILQFCEKRLKALDTPWQDRRSRLVR